MIDFLSWLLSTTGPTLVVLGVLGYGFREKWKQVLSRSLETDLARFKHELTLEQQAHAASLAPQMEVLKHDFQKSLESYKTSLIAQAEEVKLRSDVKKSLATKYLHIKFDRLVEFEREMSVCGLQIASFVTYVPAGRIDGQLEAALKSLDAFNVTASRCEMFLTLCERSTVNNLRSKLLGLLDHIGPGKQPVEVEGVDGQNLMNLRISSEIMIRDKIHAMAGL